MFLKTLTLKGFKSFADATTLELEPGITVVVGPNGTGKSNVVDAVAWVLGAQGPRTVRSSKMDDVIFAGTSKRPALGRAEVALTIDNSAGLLPIEFSEVTITRTLFRTGDSEYAINGVPCRLLDVQELLSDTGVGRQQHVIVSQGQIDGVLNARPEDRRLIVEEAAGVLKYRRRKEKAERRLAATEANLLRLQDLLREVRRQLRPLERQAEAARRHGALAEELRALRVHLAGRELAALRARLTASARTRAELAGEEAALRERLAGLDAAVVATEAALSALGEADLGDVLARVERLRERAKGLSALLAERRRGLDRDRGALLDQAVVATLEAESSRLAAELAEVEADAAGLVPAAEELGRAEDDLAARRAAFERDWGGDDGPADVPLFGRAAEVRGELVALRSAAGRDAGEHERLLARVRSLDATMARLAEEADRRRAELIAAVDAEEPLAARLDEAEARRAAAEPVVAEAEAARRAADEERHATAARAEALSLALDAARAEAGAARLADVAGVLGTLLDVVAVDPGWEPAFEAAAGEAVAAVVVADPAAGRAALRAVASGDGTGAVLALGAVAVAAGGVAGAAGAPAGGEPVRSHVRGLVPGVDALLDVLLGGAVCVRGGWEAAVDAALAAPAATVVTPEGDRFSARGWRVGEARSGVTRATLDAARDRAAEAERVAAEAAARLADARTVLDAARDAEAEARRALEDDVAAATAAGDALQRLEADHHDAEAEATTLRAHLDELAARAARERARLAELEAALPALEAEEAAGAERARARAAARRALEERAAAVGALRTDLEVRAAGLDERRTFLRRRLAEVDERLSRDAAERAAAEARRVDVDRRIVATDRLAALVADRLAVVEGHLADLRERRRRQSEEAREQSRRLDGLRSERADAERRLSEVRERQQRAELDEAEVRLRLETAVEALRREHDCEPEAAVDAPCPPLPDGVGAGARARELERELRLLGPVNPLALEEHAALLERHGFLESQLEDVKSTRRELAKVIRAVDDEIVSVFAAAYADVADNFEKLFETLFPGGKGRLRLTDPEDLLATGIEVEARPSGKNVRKLSLLSGGERSLTALAFLFAVFRSRPSPFYVMDEVEAALDDVNLHRFLDLIAEFRTDAQLLIVSHQKRTMEAADCLYGVTMEPGGSSRVLSERVSAGA